MAYFACLYNKLRDEGYSSVVGSFMQICAWKIVYFDGVDDKLTSNLLRVQSDVYRYLGTMFIRIDSKKESH